MRHSASRRSWAAALTLLAVLVLAPSTGFSGLPQTINYQGSLSDGIGAPINGTVDMTFTLYDAATGGTVLWTETQTAVPVTAGIFNVTLGSVTVIPPSILANKVFLGIAAGTDPEMTPRQGIDAVAYSMRAKQAILGFDLSCTACVAETELTFDPATQVELDAHGANVSAHHTRYTDAEAIAAVGPVTDTLAGLSCTSGQIASWNGAAWVCAADADTPALTDAEVDTFATNGALNLFAGTTLSGAAIQTGTEADTLAGLACTSGQIPSWSGAAWVCAADADTPALTEVQVEGFVTNGALNLFAGTTLSGATIQTGTEADTLAGLACTTDQIARYNGAAWVCATAGVNWVASALTPVGAGAPLTVTATCAAGDVATGGGWQADSSTVVAVGSYPDTLANPATAWKVDVQNTDVSGHNVTAYVICATP